MWPFWLIAIVCTVSCAVFARVRVILRNAHRSRSVQRVCASVIPTQGSVFVMIHCPDASEKCARLYQDLMDTAACPKRVFVGVYQEMTHSPGFFPVLGPNFVEYFSEKKTLHTYV